jgi:hypothetical protein
LLAQVADVERGERIRGRREALHLTQPAVVELLEREAYALPRAHDLHPDNAGKPPVTLRGYQTYEQGGGIVWEKAKLLAKVLGFEVQEMMNGEPVTEAKGSIVRKVDTPELLTMLNSDNALAEALAEFTQAIRKQNQLLDDQTTVLGDLKAAMTEIKNMLGKDASIRDETQAATQRLMVGVDAANQALQGAAQHTAKAPGKQAK